MFDERLEMKIVACFHNYVVGVAYKHILIEFDQLQ